MSSRVGVSLCVAVISGTSDGLVWGDRWLKVVAGNLGKSAMEALTELVGLILTLRPTLAGDHDARRGHPGKTSKPDELPAHGHQLRRVVA
jgi:hypothetical protein